jgi:bifunctional enzyme CysN/CysC
MTPSSSRRTSSRSLERDSRKHERWAVTLDFALLVDGLEAEREQGITIDVAYRFFATDRRKFIVADTPGHEQYTRNMATGASTADLALLLVDARQGICEQTRATAYIASLTRHPAYRARRQQDRPRRLRPGGV